MRNGNISLYTSKDAGCLGSYRTYEEWKPSATKFTNGSVACSYRTYEEWKHSSIMIALTLLTVLTVPMRNGNNARKKPVGVAERVLTVPMRNGN